MFFCFLIYGNVFWMDQFVNHLRPLLFSNFCFFYCVRYNFNKVAQYKQLTLEEAEEKMKNRRKTADGYQRWMMKAANNGPALFGEVDNEKETGGSSGGGGRGRKKPSGGDEEEGKSLTEGRKMKRKRRHGKVDSGLIKRVMMMMKKVQGVVILTWMMMTLRRVSCNLQMDMIVLYYLFNKTAEISVNFDLFRG